jgi:hypothetical protein
MTTSYLFIKVSWACFVGSAGMHRPERSVSYSTTTKDSFLIASTVRTIEKFSRSCQEQDSIGL